MELSRNDSGAPDSPAMRSLTHSLQQLPTSRIDRGSRVKKIIEVATLTSVILIVWCLFALPTVFYILSATSSLPPQQSGDSSIIVNDSSSPCADSYDVFEADQENQSLSTLMCTNSSNQMAGLNENASCAEGFYFDNRSLPSPCSPLCTYWLSNSIIVPAIDTAISILSLIATVALTVLALWCQRDTMLVFPTVYLLFICLAQAVTIPVVLVGHYFRKGIFCRSDSLIESLENETTFCAVSGVLNIYVVAQVTLWITFHALGIMRSVVFPFAYRQLKAEKKLVYINFSTVVAALFLPLIPSLLHLIDGYDVTMAPFEVCIGQNVPITYFTFLLPASILLAVTSTALIIIFWKIMKEFLVKKRSSNGKLKSQIRTAQAKILFIMCYYIIFGAISIIGYTLFITANNTVSERFTEYFLCQSVGVQFDRDCGPEPEGPGFQTRIILLLLSTVLLRLMPVVILVFTAKCSCKTRPHRDTETLKLK